MNTLIVYESMFGSTRTIADSIAETLRAAGHTVTETDATGAPDDVGEFDAVFIGAPTHAHTLPQHSSRVEASHWAADPAKKLTLEADPDKPGLREWLDRADIPTRTTIVAFSTRADIPRLFAGDAAASITHRLHKRGLDVRAHEDFLVDSGSRLLEGETERARQWATQFAGAAADH